MIRNTVCPRSSDPFAIVTYSIKYVTTSWTDGIIFDELLKITSYVSLLFLVNGPCPTIALA